MTLDPSIVRTLLYYEIFEHPLTADELFYLLPRNSISKSDLTGVLERLVRSGTVAAGDGFYWLGPSAGSLAEVRLKRTRLARRRLVIARFMAGVIKHFPFVRAVFISGDLSKGVANPKSDIDYVVVTEPGRLWICRSLLVAFKKVFLLNSKKYFCLNYYLDSDHLSLDDRNYYTATEVAHLKPLFNTAVYLRYMNANGWIRSFFPNYRIFSLWEGRSGDRRSIIQPLLELPFRGRWAARLDLRLMEYMRRTWKSRYPRYDDETRERIFRCNISESRAFVGNFSDRVLERYRRKLQERSLPADFADDPTL
jgi:hypothetical protein